MAYAASAAAFIALEVYVKRLQRIVAKSISIAIETRDEKGFILPGEAVLDAAAVHASKLKLQLFASVLLRRPTKYRRSNR